MLIATLVFATQDGLSRYLAEKYSVTLTIILRFWALAAGISLYFFLFKKSRSLVFSKRPLLQILRSSILVAEIFVTVYSFTIVGLVATSAIFSSYPLLVVIFSYFILKEDLTKLKFAIVLVGFLGVLIIVKPGGDVFQIHSIIPFIGAVLFALYGVLTRMASFSDSSYTSLIWTGLIGAFFSTLIAPFYIIPIEKSDILLMSILCILGIVGHFVLIKAFEFAEAAVNTRLFNSYICGYFLILTRQHCQKYKKLKIFHINVCQLGFYSNLKTMAKIFFCQVWLFN